MTENKVTEVRIVKLCVCKEGEDLCSEKNTFVEIVDEGAGEFLLVKQYTADAPEGEIRIDKDEWPAIKGAIDEMAERVR